MLVKQLRDGIRQNRVWRAVYRLVDNLDQHHASLAASAMAFDAFLSLVPLAAFAGFILGHLHETGDLVLQPLLKTAPTPVQALVDDAFVRLHNNNSAVLAPISLAAFLWVSSSGLSTAMSVFEAVFHSPPRSFWHRRAIAMACVIGAVAVLAVVVAGAILIATISGSLGTRVIAVGVPIAVVMGMLSAFFRIAIRGPRPRERRIVPGAVVTVTLWSLVSAAFSFYVSTLARYATLYGGLAAVAIFLFWLWLLSLAQLAGGEINAQLEGVRDSHSSAYPPPLNSGMPAALFTPLPRPPGMPLFRGDSPLGEESAPPREGVEASEGGAEHGE
jgi:membrane protein